MENKKMKNVANYIEIASKVLKGCFLAGAIVCGIFAILVLILGTDMISSFSLEFGNISVYLKDSYPMNEKLAVTSIVVELVITALMLVGLFFAMKFLKNIVIPIKDGRPFEESITKNLRSLAWTSLIIGGLNEILKVVESLFTNALIDFNGLFVSNYVDSIELDFEIDYTFVAIFGVIMFLSFIFQYVQKLQKESDETL